MQRSLHAPDGRPYLRELEPRRLVPNLTAGAIVGFLCVMVSVSLGAFVYSGELAAFRMQGIGLALLSTLLVGAAVTALSSLPGMSANLQDAPAAIFAVTAAALVAGLPAGTPPETAFATVVAASAATTLLVAAAFLASGSFRWGRLVRYLPYPVVGGFLAGTGWLLFVGGIGMMADVPIRASQLATLFSPELLARWLPGLAFALFLLWVTARVRHFLVWPLAMLAGTAAFYATMGIAGGTVEAWRAYGLLLGAFPDGSLVTTIRPEQWALVQWDAVLGQAAGAATIIVVCLMALLFNTTGLELATEHDVDLDRELRAAGTGNLLSGLFGGMVGYQVLSFTMVNHKVGTGSRVASGIAVLFVGLALAFGASVLSYVPTMLAGGLLVFLGLGFLQEWAVDAARRLPRLEHAIILLILAAIAAVGLLQGVLVGVVAALVLFAVNYSRADVVRRALAGSAYASRVSRGRRERAFLESRRERLFVLQLQGYVFFGTASGLLARLERRFERPPRPTHVILDARGLTGSDATAVRVFVKAARLVRRNDATFVLCGLPPLVEAHFRANGLLDGTDAARTFASLDEALEWWETEALSDAPFALEPEPSFDERLASHIPDGESRRRLLAWLERREFAAGEALIRQGDAPDSLYFIESGRVTARFEGADGAPVRLESMQAGSVVGELGFFTGATRTASVVADGPTVALRVTQAALERMTADDPESSTHFHRVINRLLADRVTHLVRVVTAQQ